MITSTSAPKTLERKKKMAKPTLKGKALKGKTPAEKKKLAERVARARKKMKK